MTKVMPKLKKRINAFLIGEDGKVSKSNILNVSTVLIGAGILLSNSNIAAAHSDSLAVTANGCSATSSHTSHSSHASHGSHCNCNLCG